MRKHDFQVGWFHEMVRRHGAASAEMKQAQAFREIHGQLYFKLTYGPEEQADLKK